MAWVSPPPTRSSRTSTWKWRRRSSMPRSDRGSVTRIRMDLLSRLERARARKGGRHLFLSQYNRPMLKFQGLLEAGRGGGSFVQLPREVAEVLGGGRYRVKGALNGVAFASSTMPMGGGRVCVGIHKAVREAARARSGAQVIV